MAERAERPNIIEEALMNSADMVNLLDLFDRPHQRKQHQGTRHQGTRLHTEKLPRKQQVGIGLVLTEKAEGLVVAGVLPGGAASKDKRISTGDVISHIDGQKVHLLRDAKLLMLGDVGTYVDVTIFRPLLMKTMVFNIWRPGGELQEDPIPQNKEWEENKLILIQGELHDNVVDTHTQLDNTRNELQQVKSQLRITVEKLKENEHARTEARDDAAPAKCMHKAASAEAVDSAEAADLLLGRSSLVDARKQLYEMHKELQQAKSQLRVTEEKIKESEHALREAHDDAANAKRMHKAASAETADLLKQLDEMHEELQEAKSQLRVTVEKLKENEHTRTEARDDAAHVKCMHKAASAETVDSAEAADLLLGRSSLVDALKQLDEMHKELQQAKSQLRVTEEKIKESEHALREAHDDAANAKRMHKAASAETADLLKQLDEMHEELQHAKLQVNSTEKNFKDNAHALRGLHEQMNEERKRSQRVLEFQTHRHAEELQAHDADKSRRISELESHLDKENDKSKECRELEINLSAIETKTAVLQHKLMCMEVRVAEEKQRRIGQAKRTIQRLLHSQLAYAFDSYLNSVIETKCKRETCKRVALRMQHRAFVGAFDMFIGTVEQLKLHRQIVEKKVMGRWRTPATATAMWAWMEYMQVVAQERKDKALGEALNQLSEMSEIAKTDKEELNRAVESEKERRTEQSKRIVQGLLHRQLAQAFGSFYDRVAQLKDKKDMSKRMIQRMLRTHLAAAFDCFSEAIQLRVAHQSTVTKTISRRRTPLVKEMFECWLEYLDDVNQKVKEEAHAQAKQQIADELAKEKCAGEERVAEEKQHRAEQAKRIVQRLLHSQLAYAFDSYLCRALEVRRQRKTCRRVVLRMQHGALAGAFDMFIGTVEQLKAYRQIVEKVIGRWRTPATATAMWAWMEYMQVVAQERKDKALDEARNQLSGMSEIAKTDKEELNRAVESEKERRKQLAERIVKRILHSQLAYGFDSYLNGVIETKCKRETCRRVVLRMQHRAMEDAFDMFVGTVEQLKAHRQIVEKAMARWRAPLLMLVFVAWLKLADEKQRRTEQAKRIEQRLLHSQLAYAFYSYAHSVSEVMRQRERRKAGKVMMQLMKVRVVMAFELWREYVEVRVMKARREARVFAISIRYARNCLVCALFTWVAFSAQAHRFRLIGIRLVRRWQRLTIESAWSTWLNCFHKYLQCSWVESLAHKKRVLGFQFADLRSRIKRQCLLGRGFWAFDQSVKDRRKIKSTVQMKMACITSKFVVRAFGQFHVRTTSHRFNECQRRCQKVVKYFAKVLLRITFQTWARNITFQTCVRQAKLKIDEEVRQRVGNEQSPCLHIYMAFFVWAENAADSVRLRNCLCQYIRRRKFSLRPFLSHWISEHKHLVARKSLLDIILQKALNLHRRFKMLALSARFVSWARETSDKKRLAIVVLIAMKRLEMQTVPIAFVRWKDHRAAARDRIVMNFESQPRVVCFPATLPRSRSKICHLVECEPKTSHDGSVVVETLSPPKYLYPYPRPRSPSPLLSNGEIEAQRQASPSSACHAGSDTWWHNMQRNMSIGELRLWDRDTELRLSSLDAVKQKARLSKMANEEMKGNINDVLGLGLSTSKSPPPNTSTSPSPTDKYPRTQLW